MTSRKGGINSSEIFYSTNFFYAMEDNDKQTQESLNFYCSMLLGRHKRELFVRSKFCAVIQKNRCYA